MRYIAIVISLILVMIPSAVLAGDFDDNELSFAPPELDQTQAARWVNSLPTSKVYLARMYGVDQRTAEKYGAMYKLPINGLTPASSTASSFSPTTGGTRWDINFKTIETYVPLTVEYIKPEQPTPLEVKYDVPEQLDSSQAARWQQALPWARWYLARLYGISEETARKYGAR